MSLTAACGLLLCGLGSTAAAQEEPSWDDEPTWSAEPRRVEERRQEQQRSRERREGDGSGISVRGGIGFTGGPETFLMSLETPFAINELISVGPHFRLGVSDDEVYFTATGSVYVTPRLGGDIDVIRPYGSLGLGIAVLEKDDRRRRRDDEDVDFLLSPGLGVEWAFADQLFVGTGVNLDVIPAGVAGQRFVFSWQVVTFRAEF